MQKIKQYWIIILLMVIVGGGLFYWYEWRPNQIRRQCVEEIFKDAWKIEGGEELSGLDKIDSMIKVCLLSRGIKD